MTFRFGVVAATARTGAEWTTTARQAEELGYDTLLVPDTVETKTLQLLSGGRFELGIGGGRPGAERDAAMLGVEFGTPGERLRRVADTIRAVRELPGGGPPVMVAASKPGMLRLAAEQADVVALGLPPQSSEKELAETVARLRGFGGTPEVHVNVAAVAETAEAVPEWVDRMVGGDARRMAAAGGIAFLLGDPGRIAETLRRRRAELGISYIGVSAMFLHQFAPVITRLRADDSS